MTPACEAMHRALFAWRGHAPRSSAYETTEFWERVTQAGLYRARALWSDRQRDQEVIQRAAASAMCTEFWRGHPEAEGCGQPTPHDIAREHELAWWPAARALLAAATAERKAAA